MTSDSTMSDSTPGSSPVREMKELLAEVTLKILRGAVFQAAASTPTPPMDVANSILDRLSGERRR